MTNPVINAYKTLDDVIMYAANKAVHAWNWTTGGTKSDLTTFISANAAIIGFLGSMNLEAKDVIVLTPTNLVFYFFFQRMFEKTDRNEIGSADRELKNIEVEMDKTLYSISGPTLSLGWGPLFLGSSYMQFQNHESQRAEGTAMAGFGWFLHGVASYVMRTDYITPRRNVIIRLVGGIKEIMQKYNAKPELIPVPYSY